MTCQNCYSFLSKLEDVNGCIRYISAIDYVISKCKPNSSIVSIITKMLDKKEIDTSQVKPLICAILVYKWKYRSVSLNLASPLKDIDGFIKKVSLWNAVDIILKYEHPELGAILINPKDACSKSLLEMLKKNELLVLYVGYQGHKEISEKITQKIMDALYKMLQNIKTIVPKEALTGKFIYKKNEKKNILKDAKNADGINNKNEDVEIVPISMGHLKTSQILSVVVSNELFHNGNVEAWKNIIQSYNAKYKRAKVLIFYEGESILNINALFKWGKVRYGSVIQFAVVDENIRDLSKLLRYLKEGASSHFEFFLDCPPNAVLNLF